MEQIIALTQRVSICSRTGERRDCLDQRWAPFLERLGYTVAAVPNCLENPVAWFRTQNCTALILSGGNDLSHVAASDDASQERDQTEIALVAECRQRQLPVVGVCRGLQMINHIFDGTMRRCASHAGSRHSLRLADGADEIWNRTSVNSYHDWGILPEDLAGGLRAVCFSEDGMIEAVVADNMPVWGIMWHPERESPSDDFDIRLFRMMLGSDV